MSNWFDTGVLGYGADYGHSRIGKPGPFWMVEVVWSVLCT